MARGSPYIAKDTQIFARQLGLKPGFTPLRDAQTVLGLIGTWIEDYNDHHPHSGPKMCSPREFIATQTATA